MFQFIKTEADRRDDFLSQLSMIEDQLARVGENGALAVDSVRTRFQTVALKLLTAIVDFFYSALEHFSHGIVRKSLIY
jgi:hypothetical protein